jgi:hypothetical protein
MCADSGAVASCIITTGTRKATTGQLRSESAIARQMRMSPSTCGFVAACSRVGTSRSAAARSPP